MGYEITLKIGKVIQWSPKDKPFLLDYASLDLCKPGPGAMADLASRKPSAKHPAIAYYDGYSEEEKDTDSYGAKHPAIKLDEVIAALEKDNAPPDRYRRYDWALALLKAMNENNQDNEIICVIHGH